MIMIKTVIIISKNNVRIINIIIVNIGTVIIVFSVNVDAQDGTRVRKKQVNVVTSTESDTTTATFWKAAKV